MAGSILILNIINVFLKVLLNKNINKFLQCENLIKLLVFINYNKENFFVND